MGRCRIVAAVRRSSVLAVLLALVGAPAGARGEARPADRLTTTGGSTTLLRPLRGASGIRSSRVTVDLYGDHATITQDVTAAGAGEEYELLAPLSEPDAGPWPGHVATGDFTSFAALAPDGRPLDVKSSLDTAPVGRLLGQLTDDAWRFVIDRSPAAVRRFRVAARKDAAQLRAVWTVPYLGDTYHGIKPLDCTCGDPWNFSLHMIGLVIDPAGGATTQVSIANRTGAAAVLRRAGKDAAPGGKWDVTLQPGQGDQRALVGAGPLSITFAENRLKPLDLYPRTRLSLSCGSPQEDAEDKSEADGGPAADARRRKRLARDRAAFRWDAVCYLGDKTSARKPAPKFLKLDGSESSGPRKDWFIRGFSREILGATWNAAARPSGVGAWPVVQGDLIRPAAASVLAEASSTLPAKGDVYHAHNLVDGDPMSTWCEGDAADGRGARIKLAFPTPANVAALAILPGYVKADWLYEANAAPKRVRVIAETRTGKSETVHDIALPDSAELFAEARTALILPLDARDVVMLTLVVEQVRPGKYTKDLCISELIPLAR
jgi:hypothetical protein